MYFNSPFHALRWLSQYIDYDSKNRTLETNYHVTIPSGTFKIMEAELFGGVIQNYGDVNLFKVDIVTDLINLLKKLPGKERAVLLTFATKGLSPAEKKASKFLHDYSFVRNNKIENPKDRTGRDIFFLIVEKYELILKNNDYIKKTA